MPDAAVRGPQVPEKPSDTGGRLAEDGGGNPLFGTAQPEDAELVEPRGNRVAAPAGQLARRGEVNLVPRPLGLDHRRNAISEHRLRQAHDDPRELGFTRRVLDRVPREGAPVTDQVPEQRKLVVAQRGGEWSFQLARERDQIARGEL